MDSRTLTLLSPFVLSVAKRGPPFILRSEVPPFVLSVA